MTASAAKPLSRGERRTAHAYKVSAYHTHEVPARRKVGTAIIRCTRRGCAEEARERNA